MTNKKIAKLLKQTATLLELHDENPFKIRTYTNAVFNIEKQQDSLFEKNLSDLEALEGIGKSLAKSIVEIQKNGSFALRDELIAKTPVGIREMIELKGLGAKKIKMVWKELDIENMDQLYEACKLGQLAKLKGFGTKTQETMLKTLEFLISQRGKARFADAEPWANHLLNSIRNSIPDCQVELTGEMRRKMDVVNCVELIINLTETTEIKALLDKNDAVEVIEKDSGPFSLRGSFKEINLKWQIRFSDPSEFHGKWMLSTGSGSHLASIAKDSKSLSQHLLDQKIESEETAYQAFDKPFILPELREGTFELNYNLENPPPKLLDLEDIKGPFHNHSNYSDGKNPIRELAEYCIEQGYEYLGLSDHSKSAFYANGLHEFQIQKQHEEIDELNKELAPFRIFKGIESDILNDGSLDYENNVLASFDFIVASVHSNLNMDRNKATERMLKAIENPYTTILGHPTSRLLLKRLGYPLDHKTIIDACSKHNVIIEINANPWRLDIDWRWVNYALTQGVILSINPDAHEIEGFSDMKFGVYMGRKGGLTADKTFNTWGLKKVEDYLTKRKENI